MGTKRTENGGDRSAASARATWLWSLHPVLVHMRTSARRRPAVQQLSPSIASSPTRTKKTAGSDCGHQYSSFVTRRAQLCMRSSRRGRAAGTKRCKDQAKTAERVEMSTRTHQSVRIRVSSTRSSPKEQVVPEEAVLRTRFSDAAFHAVQLCHMHTHKHVTRRATNAGGIEPVP